MATWSLLEMVQDILNDMDSDEVNSINDTVEALQVAQILKNSYYTLISTRNWKSHRNFIALNAVSDTTRPNYLQLPENVAELEWMKYNVRTSTDTRDNYEEIQYMEPSEFLDLVHGFDSSASNVKTVTDFGGGTLYCKTDKRPTYWTSFDDEYLVFDSYDSAVDTTMQGSKSQAFVYSQPSWTVSDTFVPDLPTDGFMELIEEAKSTAFATLKQAPNQKVEQKAQRTRKWNSRKQWRMAGGIGLPDYGKAGRPVDPTFKQNRSN